MRWKSGEFTLLYSDGIVLEYIEKLLALGDSAEEVREFVRTLNWRGERVRIAHFHLHRYPSDADDIPFVLCAVNGKATHLVTYDAGFSEIADDSEFTICKPLEFLAALRSSQVP
jgi:predicted nucleic acid-binding protein